MEWEEAGELVAAANGNSACQASTQGADPAGSLGAEPARCRATLAGSYSGATLILSASKQTICQFQEAAESLLNELRTLLGFRFLGWPDQETGATSKSERLRLPAPGPGAGPNLRPRTTKVPTRESCLLVLVFILGQAACSDKCSVIQALARAT